MPNWIDFYNAVDTTVRGVDGEPLNPEEPEEEWVYEQPKTAGVWTLIKQMNPRFPAEDPRGKDVCLERPDHGETFGWIMSRRWERIAYHSMAQEATGDILMGGLGIGWEPWFLNEDPNVTSITVVEMKPDIITLSSPVLADKNKVTIIEDRVLHHMINTRNTYDTIYFDIFENNPVNFPDEVRILTNAANQILNPDGKVIFWRQHRPLVL